MQNTWNTLHVFRNSLKHCNNVDFAKVWLTLIISHIIKWRLLGYMSWWSLSLDWLIRCGHLLIRYDIKMICDNCGTMYDGFVLVYNGVKIHRRQTQGQNICKNGSHFFFLEKSNCVNLLLQKQEKKRGFHFITGKPVLNLSFGCLVKSNICIGTIGRKKYNKGNLSDSITFF